MSDIDTRDLVETQRRDEVLLFLGKKTEKLRAGGGGAYDLISEYRKTRKNRSALVPLLIIAVITVFILASFLVTRSIDSQSRKVAVGIDNFQDLNLRDLLDLAKKSVDELDASVRELAGVEASLQSELDGLSIARAAALSVADAMGLSPSDLSRRRAAITAEYGAKQQALRNAYAPRIAAKRQEVSAFQERVAAYDAGSLEQARKQQESLDNERQLFELEQKKLTDFYEGRLEELQRTLKTEKADGAARLESAIRDLTKRYERELAEMVAKFNPVLGDARSVALLAAADPALPRPTVPSAPAAAPKGSPIGLEAIRATASRYDDLHYLIGRLRDVPYINSIPPALAAADAAGAELARGYAGLLSESSSAIVLREQRIAERDQRIVERDQRIVRANEALAAEKARLDSYAYALSRYARGESDAGLIVDARDSSRVLVFIDPAYQIADGMTAWVFRSADEPIAELRFKKTGDELVARVEKMEEGQEIQPFDRILLSLSGRDLPEVR
ncbi:MAG: hypothetical protein A2Z99_11640 [Treponema sp. GWB1_62_6]|nr:MAG: hypothetical protein A2Y36_17405 [Treponema sp. GWA1_62_8]OHE64618.1 MAG: hypothetical protein A2001_04880 [Treponema sp. GWC1_61_84]OHE68470.1 MAG: hypothetical protein A2Z99_11640 [Treponema sp. GWB1_62_6]HCM28963.1 hypothetical protein [Treponema sp.]